jgi:AraC family transcriptional regulator
MELQTHGVRKYPPTSALLASSAGLGWSTISVELRSHGVSEAPAIVPQHVEICLVVAGNKDGLVWRAGAGFRQEAMPKTGAIWLSPAGVGKEIVITAPIPQTMHLYLPTALFDRLKDDFNLPVAPAHSIRLAVGIGDDVIDQVGRSILSELTVETAAGRMYVETASLMLAARLIHKYRDCGSSALTALDAHPLDHVRLRRVLDYISTNVDDDITLADMARVWCPGAPNSLPATVPHMVPCCAHVYPRNGRLAPSLCQPHAPSERDGRYSRRQTVSSGESL